MSLERYIAWGRHAVSGWLTSGAVELLCSVDAVQQERAITGNVGEIGIHHGKLFILLHLLRQSGERSVAIDVFEKQDLNLDGSGAGDRRIFERNLRRHVGSLDEVIVISADSTTLTPDAVVQAVGGGLRLFSIDGGHTADVTLHDLGLAAGSIVPAGVVILDDCFNEQWPGVMDGTQQFLDQQDDLVPFAIGFNKVLLTTPGYSDAYRPALHQLAEDKGWYAKTTEMHGHDVTIIFPRPRSVRLAECVRPLRRLISRVRATPLGRRLRKVVRASTAL